MRGRVSRRRNPVSPSYFDTMEIPLVEGRDISDRDRDGRAGVAVVSQSFARRFWPDGQALGRRLKFPLPGSPFDRQWFTIFGIVGDAKYRELRGSRLDSTSAPRSAHIPSISSSSVPPRVVPTRSLGPFVPRSAHSIRHCR